MLKIGKPFIEYVDDKVRLCARLEFPNKRTTLWFAVDKEYEKYLTLDRSDAFVVSMLTAAMKAGEDIICEAPVTRRLLYQLNHYLIPVLATNTKRYHSMKICGEPIDQIIENAGAVGVGWTAGVDCFYTFLKHSPESDVEYKISHLLVANIGTFEDEPLDETLATFVRRARGMADDFGIDVVAIDSNIHLVLDENYLSVAGFRLPAAVLTLQGLFRVFLHSSGSGLANFVIDELSTARYEMMILGCLETDNTAFYSSGSEVTRLDKTKALTEYPPAWKRLHTCIHPQDKNCGQCAKCQLLLSTLYAEGKLERFASVIDVDEIQKDIESFIKNLVIKVATKTVATFDLYEEYAEVLELLKAKQLISSEILRYEKVLRAATKISKK